MGSLVEGELIVRHRRTVALVIATALCGVGCSSTVDGTAVASGAGDSTESAAGGTFSAALGSASLEISDFPSGTYYEAVNSLTVATLVPNATAALKGVTVTPDGCLYPTGASEKSTSVDGASFVVFKQGNGDVVTELITDAAVATEKDVLAKAETCSSYTATISSDVGTLIKGTNSSRQLTESETGIRATIITTTINTTFTDGTPATVDTTAAVVAVVQGALTVLTFSGPTGGDINVSTLDALATAALVKLKAVP